MQFTPPLEEARVGSPVAGSIFSSFLSRSHWAYFARDSADIHFPKDFRFFPGKWTINELRYLWGLGTTYSGLTGIVLGIC
jgi:hypothetical protein